MRQFFVLSAKIIAITTFVFAAILFAYTWFGFGLGLTNQRAAFEHMSNALLRVPFVAHSHYVDQALISDLKDLEAISYDDWMSIECECPDSKKGWYSLPMASEHTKKYVGKEGQKHIYCTASEVEVSRGFKNKMPKNCTNMFNCNSLELIMNDYVLKYPKVLRNLIKIAEKPCFYVKELPNEKDEHDLWFAIQSLRHDLQCDYNNRSSTIIYLVDKEGALSMQITIPRIDTIGKFKLF